MNTSDLIRILLIAAALTAVGRRWRVPYLQAAVRIEGGSVLVGFARGASSWMHFLIAAIGLIWIALGASEFWRQRSSHRLEGH